MDSRIHVWSDFQLFLIPDNAPINIQMMLRSLRDSCMNKALPIVRWGGNAQEILLGDILTGFNYQHFVILPSNIETVSWKDSIQYNEYGDTVGG
jgi:hypothetical protein